MRDRHVIQVNPDDYEHIVKLFGQPFAVAKPPKADKGIRVQPLPEPPRLPLVPPCKG